MTHNDCKYYLATDVFKGICKRDKSNVNADDASCEHCQKAPKCKHCQHFTSAEEDLGWCMNKTAAFPEMLAFTCQQFIWN